MAKIRKPVIVSSPHPGSCLDNFIKHHNSLMLVINSGGGKDQSFGQGAHFDRAANTKVVKAKNTIPEDVLKELTESYGIVFGPETHIAIGVFKPTNRQGERAIATIEDETDYRVATIQELPRSDKFFDLLRNKYLVKR